ncbi:carbonic anhydrase 1-like [Parasteatoda tepidariorum]|uniref:carbonic anhydrase 1-like n=1 Tax=Parasteatoda tepidariorum TaxID=114398 RepID=UPI00077FB9E3
MKLKDLMHLTFSLIILTFCFTISTAECPADNDKDWSYDNSSSNGPDSWGQKYPKCNGNSQSPINIVSSQTVNSGTRQILMLSGYENPVGKLNISNDGHFLDVKILDGVERSVTIDDKKYSLSNFHFHWGSSTDMGSEHELNGNKYTMEVHLVHRDSDGNIVVIAGFLSESGNQLNSAIDNLLYVKPAYEYKGEHYEGEIQRPETDPRRQGKIYLDDLINERCRYYRYSGSMAFPPCNEGVTWLICRQDNQVKTNQVNELLSLYSVSRGTPNEDQCHLINIDRPVQPLNERKIYT